MGASDEAIAKIIEALQRETGDLKHDDVFDENGEFKPLAQVLRELTEKE